MSPTVVLNPQMTVAVTSPAVSNLQTSSTAVVLDPWMSSSTVVLDP